MKARAAVQVADRQIEMQTFDIPQIEADQALLRVEGGGMCGTDREQFAGDLTGNGWIHYPVIPGHEPVGRIVEIGDAAAAAWGVGVGDRIAVEAFIACHVCDNCLRGMSKFCTDRFLYGFTPTTVGCGLWGGFGEYMLLLPGTVLHRVSEELSIEDAVLFNPLGAGYEWAVRRAGTQVGDRVLILGPGQRGLACVVAAREAGAATVIVTGLETDRRKLDLALELGADEAIVVDDDTVPKVLEATGGKLLDRVVDTAPVATRTLVDAVELATHGGTVVVAGMKGARPIDGLYTDKISLKALNMLGVMSVSSWGYKQAIRMIASRKYPLEKMHTHTLPLEQLEHGINLLAGAVPGEEAIHITITP